MKNKGMTYKSFDIQGKLNGCHYYIQDYQGNNREVVNASTNAIEQINHYYSYGSLMGVISTKPDAQQFKYGGKELDLSDGLNLYDFEARPYDPEAPDFTSVDPLAHKYYWLSPYSYCGGDPVNCIDPDGNATIWIGGFYSNPFDKANSHYWPSKMLNDASKRWGNSFIFKDGSLGGIANSWRTMAGMPIRFTQVNLMANNRYKAGYDEGQRMAFGIIARLKRKYNFPSRNNTSISRIAETLQVITHSMGGAYGQGFTQAIIDYCKKHPELCEGLQLVLYHFSPFQAEDIPEISEIDVYQMHHKDDSVAPYAPIDGATQQETKSEDGGHSIASYQKEIESLPEGTYVFRNGHFVPK